MTIKRFEIYLVNLDPAQGHEIKKTRPCLVISPDEMNRNIQTCIIAPMTTVTRDYPTRVKCKFQGKSSEIVLDQIRTVDQNRLVKKLGKINETIQENVLGVLNEMFAK